MRIGRGDLEGLVQEGLTIRAIATRLGVTTTTVQRALRRYELRTRRGGPRLQRSALARLSNVNEIIQDCPRHGRSHYVRRTDGGYRCRRCASEAVTRRRKRIKRILVMEAGGMCANCHAEVEAGVSHVP